MSAPFDRILPPFPGVAEAGKAWMGATEGGSVAAPPIVPPRQSQAPASTAEAGNQAAEGRNVKPLEIEQKWVFAYVTLIHEFAKQYSEPSKIVVTGFGEDGLSLCIRGRKML